jgi:dephospho-CoA kinase
MAKKLVVGLVGGIGSGKTAVATEFARHGAAVISGDEIGHEALRQPEIRTKVIERFGAGIVGDRGQIDRQKLGAIVFADSAQLRDLEKLVFPWIECGLEQRVSAAQQNTAVRFVVVDAAVMMEAGWDKHCDKIVFVDAPEEIRQARLLQRGWTKEEIDARTRSQMPLAEKAAKAEVIIDNSGPPTALTPQIARLVESWIFQVALQTDFLDNN